MIIEDQSMQYQNSLTFDAHHRHTPVLYAQAPENDHLPSRPMDPIANITSHASLSPPAAMVLPAAHIELPESPMPSKQLFDLLRERC